MEIGNNKGFFIEYRALKPSNCGGNYTHASGILSSPSYSNSYPQLANCIYLISQPNQAYVNISLITMDIDCPDYIEMRDGNYEDSTLMGRFCGNGCNVPAFMQTTQNHLWIRWSRQKKSLYNFPLHSSLSDSSPTLLRVAWHSSFDTNLPMCLNGHSVLVHVEAASQPQLVFSLHHPTLATTQGVQTASTLSPSHLEQLFSWSLSTWTSLKVVKNFSRVISIGMIDIVVIILR